MLSLFLVFRVRHLIEIMLGSFIFPFSDLLIKGVLHSNNFLLPIRLLPLHINSLVIFLISFIQLLMNSLQLQLQLINIPLLVSALLSEVRCSNKVFECH